MIKPDSFLFPTDEQEAIAEVLSDAYNLAEPFLYGVIYLCC
ncbi:MAG: hypothetical protein ACOYMG_24375 [Candidatus Methylumidiphilus sp.]